VTQQDAALVEQVASASDSMCHQEAELGQAVNIFTLAQESAVRQVRIPSDRALDHCHAPNLARPVLR
jgi:hypothetical protein